MHGGLLGEPSSFISYSIYYGNEGASPSVCGVHHYVIINLCIVFSTYLRYHTQEIQTCLTLDIRSVRLPTNVGFVA